MKMRGKTGVAKEKNWIRWRVKTEAEGIKET